MVAAQAIGEPGTQLTMRTFHTGGVTAKDITHGLPRVEEIFEARPPKGECLIAEVDGTIEDIHTEGKQTIITLVPSSDATRAASTKKKTKKSKKSTKTESENFEYSVPSDVALTVAKGDLVVAGQKLTEGNVNLRELFALTTRRGCRKRGCVLRQCFGTGARRIRSVGDGHGFLLAAPVLPTDKLALGDTGGACGSRGWLAL